MECRFLLPTVESFDSSQFASIAFHMLPPATAKETFGDPPSPPIVLCSLFQKTHNQEECMLPEVGNSPNSFLNNPPSYLSMGIENPKSQSVNHQ